MGRTRVTSIQSVATAVLCLAALPSGSLHAQRSPLRWGGFASHPAHALIDSSSLLTNVDAKMLALALLNRTFDAAAFARERAFAAYFRAYSQAANEFERARLAPGIQRRFEARQHQLRSIEYFTTIIGATIGQYSFSEGGFPLSVSWTSSDATVDNAEHRDAALFPSLLRVNATDAERIAQSNPSRRLDVYVVIRHVTGASMYGSTFLQLNIVPLRGEALFSVFVIPTTREVVSVFPSQESVNAELLTLLRRSWEMLVYADGRVAGNAPFEVTEELARLQRGIDDLERQLTHFGWERGRAVDSAEASLRERTHRRRRLLVQLLTAGRPLTGEARTITRSSRITIRFAKFDSTTGSFTGTIERPRQGSTNRITGTLAADEVGPRLTFDETQVISGESGLELGYVARLSDSGELVGEYSEGGLGAAFSVRDQGSPSPGSSDVDGDGVPDAVDQCSNTLRGTPVNQYGCPRDRDGDGIHDGVDRCPNTPRGTPVDRFPRFRALEPVEAVQ
jgi:hypothetical protein